MSPWERYQASLSSARFQADAEQANAAGALQGVFEQLIAAPRDVETGLLNTLKRWGKPPVNEPVAGLYLWGGVGRGKTWLMDCFYDALPFEEKLREHFHSFMQRIHDGLKPLKMTQDPLAQIAKNLAKDIRVLCLDEFHVSDIADAMLLGRFLEALFAQGVTLVTTSNTEPDNLYRDGLQRERFLPAIASLQRHCQVLEIGGETDYRLRALEKAEIYHFPLDDQADHTLLQCFMSLHPDHITEGADLTVLGRPIKTVKMAEDVVWFEFDALCRTMRAATDYIEIARRFNTVLIANIPKMDDTDNDAVARFIQLVDEFYDRNVNLIVSAASPPTGLYAGKRLAEPFKRTRSRLEEMRSREYLAKEHLA